MSPSTWWIRQFVSHFQRQRADKDCQADIVQNIRILVNISSKFRGELCQLPFTDGLYTGNVLRCDYSKQSDENAHDPEANFIQAVLQLKSHQHVDSQTLLSENHPFANTKTEQSGRKNTKSGELEAHYLTTSQPGLLELQVVNLFFSSTANKPRLKDILRNYLRILSAKRMQIRPRNSDLTRTRNTRLSEQEQTLNYGMTHITGDLCSDEMRDTLSRRYHDILEELGERIASCLQRLDTFSNTMASILSANKHIISAFKSSSSDLAKTPKSR